MVACGGEGLDAGAGGLGLGLETGAGELGLGDWRAGGLQELAQYY